MNGVTKEFLEAQMRVWIQDASQYILTMNEIANRNNGEPEIKPNDNLIQGAEAIKAFS
jgi:hypothetical protein